MSSGRIRSLLLISVVALLGLLGGCASSPPGTDGFAYTARSPLPLDTDSLRPGLAVLYFKHHFVRSLDALPKGEEARAQGWTGPPIPYLNDQFGRGDIFDSGTNRGIAMELEGFIRFEQPGTYRFKANSNDGIRMYIGSQLLIDDPEWHSDRMTPESHLAVGQPGWYSLRLRYFQRKGTASLQLYWKPPGQDHFAIVPAKVLAHQPSD
jgi:hypothetical protein